MGMNTLNVAQLKLVQDMMKQLRESIAAQALHGALEAGFADHGARNLAAMMTCIGAAQLMGGTNPQLYEVFRLLCLEMAQGSSESVVMRRLADMGPEMFGGDITPPKGIIR